MYLDRAIDNLRNDFGGFVSRLRAMEDPAQVAHDFVPQTTFWLVHDREYIGRLSLRHCLNERLEMIGGHIGYDIRPSMRRKGHATHMLALGLGEERKLRLRRVLLTSHCENIVSRRVIEANGGVLQDEIEVMGVDGKKCRYWITL